MIPPKSKGPKKDGSFSEDGSPTSRRCGCDCADKRPTNIGIVPSKTLIGPSKKEGYNKKDGKFS
jgi:hypothetical protein